MSSSTTSSRVGAPREAAELLKRYSDLATSVGVLDEVTFVILGRLALSRLGVRRLDRPREHIRRHGVGFAEDMIEEFLDAVEELGIVVLRDYAQPRELLEAMRKYKLPPSDAVIASTY